MRRELKVAGCPSICVDLRRSASAGASTFSARAQTESGLLSRDEQRRIDITHLSSWAAAGDSPQVTRRPIIIRKRNNRLGYPRRTAECRGDDSRRHLVRRDWRTTAGRGTDFSAWLITIVAAVSSRRRTALRVNGHGGGGCWLLERNGGGLRIGRCRLRLVLRSGLRLTDWRLRLFVARLQFGVQPLLRDCRPGQVRLH